MEAGSIYCSFIMNAYISYCHCDQIHDNRELKWVGVHVAYSLSRYSTSGLQSHNSRAEISGHIAFSKQRGDRK